MPGHWEGDLLYGPSNGYIVTLVERHSLDLLLAKVANRDSRSAITALIDQAKRLSDELLKSLTWHRGKEMAEHKCFTPGDRNGGLLLRPAEPLAARLQREHEPAAPPVLPKGTDQSLHAPVQLNEVATELNQRPRKTLGYETPTERFDACVATIY